MSNYVAKIFRNFFFLHILGKHHGGYQVSAVLFWLTQKSTKNIYLFASHLMISRRRWATTGISLWWCCFRGSSSRTRQQNFFAKFFLWKFLNFIKSLVILKLLGVRCRVRLSCFCGSGGECRGIGPQRERERSGGPTP